MVAWIVVVWGFEALVLVEAKMETTPEPPNQQPKSPIGCGSKTCKMACQQKETWAKICDPILGLILAHTS